MQPTNDGFQSKWRQFHPQSTVWVQNPFDHDVVFQVADEVNNPYQYKVAAHATAELPGGAIATLGVKAIVDELIQNTREDVLSIWDKRVREKHEANVILRVKEAPLKHQAQGPTGQIDLSVDQQLTDDVPETAVEEEAFPEVKKRAKQAVSNIAEASLAGKKNAVIESD